MLGKFELNSYADFLLFRFAILLASCLVALQPTLDSSFAISMLNTSASISFHPRVLQASNLLSPASRV